MYKALKLSTGPHKYSDDERLFQGIRNRTLESSRARINKLFLAFLTWSVEPQSSTSSAILYPTRKQPGCGLDFPYEREGLHRIVGVLLPEHFLIW